MKPVKNISVFIIGLAYSHNRNVNLDLDVKPSKVNLDY
jgi:hypothetical protein